jgi:C1A family cysteine protease
MNVITYLRIDIKILKECFQKAPPSVDHTPKMTSVKDQGMLGSCVSFAVGAMKEWQEGEEHRQEVAEGKKDHREGKEYDYSESWIVLEF